jgi:spore coat protein H
VVAVLFICTACGAGGESTVVSNRDLHSSSLDTSAALFDPDRFLQVALTMDPSDYDVLRVEGRSFIDLFTGCTAGFEYTHFTASMTLDGELVENVDIRKKGFLGSLSSTRPSFKLNFTALVPDREFHSLAKLTLNNNNQVPGNAQQCITYDMFRRAGLPAPRCNFARVSMNGEDLGIYSNVESLDKGFLRRNFSDPNGNFYEGQFPAGDFGDFTQKGLQLKTNAERNDRSDIAAVASALNADDANLPSLLDRVVDIDEFLSFWAMESITGHGDSYTGLANNFFSYHDPGDDRFHFIPWGADNALTLESPIPGGGIAPYHYTEIPARLYAIPEYRQKFHDRIEELLATVWDEQAANRELDRIRDLTGTPDADMELLREFFAQHEQQLRSAIDGTLEQPERRINDVLAECTEASATTISGTFSNGVGFFEYEDSNNELVSVIGGASPPDTGEMLPGSGLAITLTGLGGGGFNILIIILDEGPSGEVTLASGLSLIMLGSTPDGGFGILGFGGSGSVVFDAPPIRGEPASGSFSAELILTDGADLGFIGF